MYTRPDHDHQHVMNIKLLACACNHLVTTYAAINCKIHSSVRWKRTFEIRKYIGQRLMIETDLTISNDESVVN